MTNSLKYMKDDNQIFSLSSSRLKFQQEFFSLEKEVTRTPLNVVFYKYYSFHIIILFCFSSPSKAAVLGLSAACYILWIFSYSVLIDRIAFIILAYFILTLLYAVFMPWSNIFIHLNTCS